MSNIFYDHLVIREEISTHLDAHKLSQEELTELTDLIDQILHHHTLNVILSHLPRQHHQEFIKRLADTPHDQSLLVYVQERVTVNISAEIKKQADRIKKDIISDIKKSSRSRAR